ncbi:hypothetical protein HO173_002070 [Letharia columbiana]|uniref:Uncharacterized protein n=1 Tax=Letharia columbiana TaxID=112416 RepID=A0A8H6L8C6_9LECA|nr:uncharacterized protein HO173_002070 [Letharia columbiana]KAF6239526.1 hypothetical protein HO173_002070 [Letharia columbiana]
MAYAQQPRYGGPQRPPYQDQQPSYGSSREPYAAKNGYGSRSQAAHFSGSSRRGRPQVFQSTSEPSGGSYRYNEDWPDQDNSYDGGNGRHGGRGQNRDGRWPPAQRPQGRPMEAGRHPRNDPRSRGLPQSKVAAPGRDHYHQQDPYYQSNQYREPQGYERHYQPEAMHHNGLQEHNNGEHEYDEFSHETPDNSTATQHYNRPPHSDEQDYQDPEYNAGYPQQDRGGPHDRGISSGNFRNDRPPRQPEAPTSRFNQNQPHSTRPQNSQHPKPSTDRVIQTPISHDAVAWDNPFPTFPLRPNKVGYANSTGHDGAMGSTSLRDDSRQDKTYDNRPQTAGSKSSYALSPNGTEKLNGNDLQFQSNTPPSAISETNSNSKGGGYFDHQPQPERDAGQYRGTAQDRPRPRDNGRRGARVDQLKPIVNGRHSEDNRTRPSLPLDTRMDTEYERSRTLPTALSGANLGSARPPDQSAWQEPGFVAGYHGPEDRGYTPTSPANKSPQGSFPQPKPYSDEGRPTQVDAVVHAQSTGSRQPHAQNDSLGEFFDTYYDTSQDDHQPYLQHKGRQHRSPADEDMPNFDGGPAPSAGRRRGMTIDDHLQPQPRTQEFPPVPVPPRDDVRGDHRNDPSSNARHPRSRSQPNFKDRRSPRPPLDDGFDFGVPGAPDRPSATAPARNEYGPSAHSTMASPNVRPDHYQQDRQYQGSMPLKGYRPNDHNRANMPPPAPATPLTAYQGNGPPDRYCSPPVQDGHSRQMGPPGGRPSPINNRTGPTSPPIASPSNPDALPSHPAPVRPGLMQSSPVNEAPKPVPLRQYDSTPSPMQLSSPTKNPGFSRSINIKQESLPVTHQELERLKQATTRNPDDPKNQLVLAKRMVEAASVLVDERADPRTRNKSREKYILDAHKIVKKLSNNGYSEATFYLADAYSRGSLGLESDTREAFKLYQSAAKAGHAQAAYRVAVCCEIGHEEGGGTSRDAVKAMQWYKRAATLGDTPAMYKMGIISLKGLLGQPKNAKEAVVWLKRAAERADEENPHALHELALLHEKPSSNEGVPRDEAYSKQLFAEAADLGYKFSQFRLGCAYEYGLMGCPVDPRQSIAWYSKAAVQEEHQSELALSGWYLTGSEGVLQQSDTEAYLWARKAAQSGLAKAEYAMGYFTEVGIGAPANLEDAKRWYWKSASQGFEKARGRLEELRRGNPAKQKTRVSRSAMRRNSEGECTIM